MATDGFDRYPSVLADLQRRRGDAARAGTFEEVFRGGNAEDILDVRPGVEKRRLFDYTAEIWSGFGYSRAYLARMESQDFWGADSRGSTRSTAGLPRSEGCRLAEDTLLIGAKGGGNHHMFRQ